MIFKGDNRNSGGLFGYELELVEKILKVLEVGRQGFLAGYRKHFKSRLIASCLSLLKRFTDT